VLTVVQHDGSSIAGESSTDRSIVSPPTGFHSPALPTISANHQRTSAYADHTLGGFVIKSEPHGDGLAALTITDPLLVPPDPNQPGFDDFNMFDDPAMDPAWFDIEPDVFFGPLGHSCGFIPGAPNIVDDVDKTDVKQSTETSTETPMSFGGISDR